MRNANINANNFRVVPVGWINSSTNLIVDSGIVKILTETRISNAKKILIRVLLSGVKDADNIATDREPKR